MNDKPTSKVLVIVNAASNNAVASVKYLIDGLSGKVTDVNPKPGCLMIHILMEYAKVEDLIAMLKHKDAFVSSIHELPVDLDRPYRIICTRRSKDQVDFYIEKLWRPKVWWFFKKKARWAPLDCFGDRDSGFATVLYDSLGAAYNAMNKLPSIK